MLGRKKITKYYWLFLIGLLGLCGCGSPSSDSWKNNISGIESEQITCNVEENQYNNSELLYLKSMELQYAQNFSVDYYEDGYIMISIMDDTKILVIPEENGIPSGLGDDVKVVKRPVKNMYLVASATMDMFDKLEAIDSIRFSGQKKENWYIDSAKAAMEQGGIIYAGKYNKPDYELIVSGNCSLAIENMMISHSPEVMEMLEDFEIPVMIDYSSYENHPLGRVEWIKLYGALVGKEAEAEEEFAKQVAILESIAEEENTQKTVAFFYVTSNGLIQVRQSNDYVPKMIALAGGRYVFENLGEPNSNRSTVNMQVEEFYNSAKDVDYIIYNSSIDGGVSSIEELLDKCAVLEDFKAVKNGDVWCTTNDMYQQSMSIGYLIKDIHSMLWEEKESKMQYLFKLY